MGRSLRFGVVGLGFGEAVHVPGLRGIDGVTVVAVAGTELSRVEKVARRLDIAHAVCGIEELLALDLDAVSLALPPAVNGQACRLVLEQGLPMLCEKPIATSSSSANELAKLGQGLTTAVDFQFPELVTFKRLREIIEQEQWGKVRHATITWHVESWVQRQNVSSWKTNENAYGGALSLLGSHWMFLTEWLFGPTVELACRLSTRGVHAESQTTVRPADDTVEILLTHDSGIVSSAFISNACPGSSTHRWEVVFERGTAVLENLTPDYMSGFVLSIRTREGIQRLASEPTEAGVDGRIKPFQSLAHRFVEAISNGTSMNPNLAHGARTQLLLDKAHEAHARRCSVTIDPAV